MKFFTDREIFDGILTRDDRRVNEMVAYLYHHNHKVISRFVRGNGGSDDDADDVFQEMIVAFLDNVWDGDFKVSDKARISTYLFEIAKNLWFKKLRSRNAARNREQIYSRSQDESRPDDPDALHEIIATEEQKWSLTIFQKLTKEAQELLRAFYHDKLSMKEIASLLKYPSDNAVKMHKHRILKELGREIRESKVQ